MDQERAPDTDSQPIASALPNRQALGVAAIIAPVVLAALLMLGAESELLDIVFTSIADAYLQVSTFVAATFLIIYGIERTLNIDATAMLRRDTIWQVPVAAGLGALPGCGGVRRWSAGGISSVTKRDQEVEEASVTEGYCQKAAYEDLKTIRNDPKTNNKLPSLDTGV